MVSYEQALFWAETASTVLIGLCLLQIGRYALRALRLGQPGVRVGVLVTTAVIGLGAALAASWLGGRLAFLAALPLDLRPAPSLMAQLGGALVLSWIVAVAYGKWVAPAVAAWFSREEAR